ncbi:MAG TPA: hypothetical protein VKU02_26755 [Gemmataceae bacterium]|nr:hypothetical protein [Gemmataceae bacterium]
MSRRAISFDSLLADRVLSYIRSGGYPQVAAEAAGVPTEVFHEWVRLGEKTKAREPYRSFARGVRQAAAQGRLVAELTVREKDPKYWLMHGPGKETDRHPGWTGEVKPSDTHASVEATGRTEITWQALTTLLMRALDSYPEARLAVAQALRELPHV